MRQKKSDRDPIRTAQGLMERHGLRAAAVAAEHASEAQVTGDATALAHWRQVQSLIVEMRNREHAASALGSRQPSLQY